MQDSSFGPVNTTIRVHENYLLKKNHYDRMLQAESYETAIRVLHDTVYRDGVDQAVITKDYEPMLKEELIRTYKWVTDQSPISALIELITLPYTYHNIEVLFKEQYTGKDFSHSLVEVGEYPLFEYRRAINLGSSTVLPPKYVENINLIHHYFDEMPTIDQLDVYLDRIYFEHMLELAEEIKDPDVTAYIIRMIDMNNLVTFLRAMAAGQGRNHIQAVLSEGGTISIEYFLDIAGMGYKQAINSLLDHSVYRSIMKASLIDDSLSLSRLELNVDNAEMNYLSAAKMKVFGPLPLIAFLYAKETEVKNIRLVLASKINSIDPAIVRDRMRLNYAI